MATLPPPSLAQIELSQQLVTAIRADIEANGGWISFARYMEQALYAPGMGYYSAGSTKFGEAGDFVTAPEISPLFARTLARQAAQVLREVGGDVLELGAGTGRLAAQMLLALDRMGMLPVRYCILEVSAHLRAVQRETLEAHLPKALSRRVEWLEALPPEIDGFVFGNEVLDALPVHLLVRHEGGVQERGVVWQAERFAFQDQPLQSPVLHDGLQGLALPAGYVTEVCPAAAGLGASLAGILRRGVLLFVDYGF